MPEIKKVPKRFQPKGFEILYEDRDLIIGDKRPGFLSVAAKWNRETTVHAALNQYIRKGSSRSRQCVYVVHRLDQDTSGVLVFAKSITAQLFLKDNWPTTKKIYYAIVHGHPEKKSGTITSFLSEDEDYRMHASVTPGEGKLAKTAYTVVKESPKYSLLKIDLLTGRKNQIRVHLANLGHPVVGDVKYGRKAAERLALHAQSITLTHPFNKKRLTVEAPIPDYFTELIGNFSHGQTKT